MVKGPKLQVDVQTASVTAKDGLGTIAEHRGEVDLDKVLHAPAVASVKTTDAKFWKHGGALGGGYLPEVSPAPPGGAAPPPPPSSKGPSAAPSPIKAAAAAAGKRFTGLAGLPQVYKAKDYTKKDRTEIEEELAKLKAATMASWTPYAMLREPATEEQRRAQEAREREQKEKEKAERKARRRARVAALQGLTTSESTRPSSRPDSATNMVKEMSIGEAAQAGGPWDLDPDYNREGGEDLRVDDPRHVRAPGWARAAALERMVLICDPGDDEVFKTAMQYVADSEGSVRAAAVHLIGVVAKRGDEAAKRRVFEAMMDPVSNVRREACYAVMGLAVLGDKPSRLLKTNLTYTAQDIKILRRDAEAIEALNKALEDVVGSVRNAASQALDKINAGWQRYRYAEIRQDSGATSPRRRRPRPDVSYVTASPEARLWGRTITHADLAPEPEKAKAKVSGLEGQKVAAAAAASADALAAFAKGQGRYTSLGGQKYGWYVDELRMQRQIRLFEESQKKAAAKVVMDADITAEPGARGVSTQWMGIEWVDRTKRTFRGEPVHLMGEGVLRKRDFVPAPYQEGYNGFGTPLGYEYI